MRMRMRSFRCIIASISLYAAYARSTAALLCGDKRISCLVQDIYNRTMDRTIRSAARLFFCAALLLSAPIGLFSLPLVYAAVDGCVPGTPGCSNTAPQGNQIYYSSLTSL